MKTKLSQKSAPWLLLAAVLVVWQLVCSVFDVSEFIFPSPVAIVQSLVEFAGPIAMHAWRTFWVTMAGFALAVLVGVVLGMAIGSSPFLYAAAYPLMTAFNALPKAAFVPILVVWFGIGAGPAILTAFLISFFPIMGIRWHHGVRDDCLERGNRLPAGVGRLIDAHAAGFRRAGRHRRDGDDDV